MNLETTYYLIHYHNPETYRVMTEDEYTAGEQYEHSIIDYDYDINGYMRLLRKAINLNSKIMREHETA